MLGLYIHVPFCSAICNYCNFNRGLFDGDLKRRYVDALTAEIRQAGLKACATEERVAADGAAPVAQPFRAARGNTIVSNQPAINLQPSAIALSPQRSAIALSPQRSAIALSPQPSAIDGVGGGAADTIYFGGGTPSLLEPEDIVRIISACASS